MQTSNYLDIPKEVQDVIRRRVFEYSPHCEIVLTSKISSNPKDWYLYLTLAYDTNTSTYIVWLYNHTDKGLSEGRYMLDFPEALGVLVRKMQ